MNANKEKRKNVNNELVSICEFICNNYDALKSEFKGIEELLRVAENCGIAYKDRKMVVMHLKNIEKSYKYIHLVTLLEMIKKIGKIAYLEFVQDVDFVNIFDVLVEENKKTGIVPLVWEIQKKQKYIMYQLDRIVKANNINKKVAILKGMMAYF